VKEIATMAHLLLVSVISVVGLPLPTFILQLNLVADASLPASAMDSDFAARPSTLTGPSRL
jgi:hypothetical protein